MQKSASCSLWLPVPKIGPPSRTSESYWGREGDGLLALYLRLSCHIDRQDPQTLYALAYAMVPDCVGHLSGTPGSVLGDECCRKPVAPGPGWLAVDCLRDRHSGMVPVGHPQRGACPAIVALETIRGDIVGFQTWKQVAKAYREKLAEKGVTGFKDAAGRDWDLRRYTEMVARTTTREVMIQGTANRLLEHGHDLAVITGGVGSNTCEVCKAWVGRTVSLTGKTQGYPTLDDARAEGLLHPNCTHNIATAMTFEGEIAKAKYVNDHEKKIQAALEEGESFWNSMDEYEQVSVKNYTDRDIGFEINNHLYNGAPVSKDILDTIELMDQILQRASLPEDMVLYRGVRPDIWQIMKADPGYITPGDEVISKGFLSSTHDRARAWKYASEKALNGDEIAMIEILAPKGTRALSIEAHSYSPSDKEILINRDTKFKVIEARKDGIVMRLVWEVSL